MLVSDKHWSIIDRWHHKTWEDENKHRDVPNETLDIMITFWTRCLDSNWINLSLRQTNIEPPNSHPKGSWFLNIQHDCWNKNACCYHFCNGWIYIAKRNSFKPMMPKLMYVDSKEHSVRCHTHYIIDVDIWCVNTQPFKGPFCHYASSCCLGVSNI